MQDQQQQQGPVNRTAQMALNMFLLAFPAWLFSWFAGFLLFIAAFGLGLRARREIATGGHVEGGWGRATLAICAGLLVLLLIGCSILITILARA